MDENLYTTEEIAKIYNVSSWTITQKWIKKGLKCIEGRPNRFKRRWVDDFLENLAEESIHKTTIYQIRDVPKKKHKLKEFKEMKLTLQDVM